MYEVELSLQERHGEAFVVAITADDLGLKSDKRIVDVVERVEVWWDENVPIRSCQV